MKNFQTGKTATNVDLIVNPGLNTSGGFIHSSMINSLNNKVGYFFLANGYGIRHVISQAVFS